MINVTAAVLCRAVLVLYVARVGKATERYVRLLLHNRCCVSTPGLQTELVA